MSACLNCGHDSGADLPSPQYCGDCPPWLCDQCGGFDSIDAPCSCWVSFEGMPLADIKAVFAADADDLSVDP